MNNSTNSKSFYLFISVLCFLAITFLASCGDDEATPDCNSLEFTATVEGNTIAATANGGAAPYQFSINSGTTQGTGNFTDLAPGTYVVEVTDANECKDSQDLTVLDPCANFSVSATASAYEITIALTSGEPPFNYIIDNGGEPITSTSDVRSFTLEVEQAADTEITITDANDCEAEASLTAEEVRTFTDSRDGQAYLTIKIGDQIWLAENLNFETENNSYCYEDDAANCETYGRLYTWDVAQTIAPEGWNVPSEADRDVLIAVLGVDSGDKIKVGGGSGFEAKLAGALLANNMSYVNLGETGYFWTSTISEVNEVESLFFRVSTSNNSIVVGETEKDNALSVRLLKQ